MVAPNFIGPLDRTSSPEHTITFSLNNYYGDAFVSEIFNTPNVGVVPILSEFNLTNDPSGSRHLTTHPGFIQTLASGKNTVSADLGPLDFSATRVSDGLGISCTRMFIFRAEQFDCDTTRLSDLKVWNSDLSDFLTPETFAIVFDTRQTNAFPSGFQFEESALDDKSLHLSRSLPDSPNVFRQDGANTIHGSGDADVSEYILMSVVASGTTSLGEYGGVNKLDGFQIRVSFNIDNIANLKD